MLKIKIMEYIIAAAVVIVIALFIIKKKNKPSSSQPQGGYGVNEDEKKPGKHNQFKED
jgi:hypothetical protein